jgi:hypothetical protein
MQTKVSGTITDIKEEKKASADQASTIAIAVSDS